MKMSSAFYLAIPEQNRQACIFHEALASETLQAFWIHGNSLKHKLDTFTHLTNKPGWEKDKPPNPPDT